MARFVQGKIIRRFRLRGRKVVFRYPKTNDLDDMFSHVNRLVEEKAYIFVQKKRTRTQHKKHFEEIFKNIRKGDEVRVCVEVDGKYAGLSSVKRKYGDARKHMVILAITLGKDFRDMGIGTELLKTMEQLAKKELGARIVELSYLQFNERSKHLYKKLGYREVGRIPNGINYYGKFCDEILMVKVLK